MVMVSIVVLDTFREVWTIHGWWPGLRYCIGMITEYKACQLAENVTNSHGSDSMLN